MALPSAVRAARRRANRRMPDKVRITRPASRTLDPATHRYADDEPTVVYAGRARFDSFDAYEARPQSGNHKFTESRTTMSLPVGTARLLVGDRVERLEAPFDPDGAGRVYRVANGDSKSYASERTYSVEERLQ